MTGRERLTAICRGRKADRLSWSCLVDGNTLGALTGDWAGLTGIEFGRRLGCDLLQLEGWGTEHHFASPAFSWGPEVAETWRQDGDSHVNEKTTPGGKLTATFRRGHPCKFPVQTPVDLRVYRDMWEGARFEPRDETAAERALNALVGDDGIVTRFWGPSAIPRLLEYDCGMQNFYYLLADRPREMAELIGVMHRKYRDAFDILARGPCGVVMLVENTSSRYISPDLYRRFNGPHVADFVDAVHAAGKAAMVHMCGHVLDLLPLIKNTRLDGVHALTEPPFGDTPWEKALDVLGDETVIIGALNPHVFLTQPREEIGRALDALYTPRLCRSNVCLCAFADGLTVGLERFQAVARWFERERMKHGH